jgi:hypothetical protein
MNRWKNYFRQLLNVHVYGINDVRLTEMDTAELFVPEHCDFETEIDIEKLKNI